MEQDSISHYIYTHVQSPIESPIESSIKPTQKHRSNPQHPNLSE